MSRKEVKRQTFFRQKKEKKGLDFQSLKAYVSLCIAHTFGKDIRSGA